MSTPDVTAVPNWNKKIDFQSELQGLADPSMPFAVADAGGEAPAVLRGMLRKMLRIRIAEEIIADLVNSGKARCPCHLGIGQEAVAVGVSRHLLPTDRVFGTHRSHSHYLALEASLHGLLAEVLGKVTGCSSGRGGSMHLYAADHGFMGSVPIVGATVPLAVGAGLAAKMDGKKGVAVAYFGDGACEEGVVHESLNLASVMNIPILFVVENNLYSSHLDISLRQPSDRVSRFADAHHIRAALVDGNDVLAVSQAAGELIAHMRDGGGPAFLEAVTFRWRGHVGADENIDVGVRRSQTEVDAWKARDPIPRLAAAMDAVGVAGASMLNQIEHEEREYAAKALEQALADPLPDASTLLDAVYAAPVKGRGV